MARTINDHSTESVMKKEPAKKKKKKSKAAEIGIDVSKPEQTSKKSLKSYRPKRFSEVRVSIPSISRDKITEVIKNINSIVEDSSGAISTLLLKVDSKHLALKVKRLRKVKIDGSQLIITPVGKVDKSQGTKKIKWISFTPLQRSFILNSADKKLDNVKAYFGAESAEVVKEYARNRKLCFLTFKSEQEASEATEKTMSYHGSDIKLRNSRTRPQSSETQEQESANRKHKHKKRKSKEDNSETKKTTNAGSKVAVTENQDDDDDDDPDFEGDEE